MSSTTARLGAVLTAATLATLAVPAMANAAGTPTNSVMGEGDVGIANVTFHARNLAATGTAATGYFVGENSATHFAGPISCLHVEGDRAGFIYTLDKTSRPMGTEGQSILITIADLHSGATGKFGFMPLPPKADLTKCAPADTPIRAASGHFTVTDQTPATMAKARQDGPGRN
jgi:hypothetical protein